MRGAVKHKSYRHFLAALVVILLVSMISLVGCTAVPSNPPPTQTPPAVPQEADFIGKIELAEIINDEDFAELYQHIAAQDTTSPQTLDAALDEVEHETGINLRDFDNVVVFGDASALLESMESSQGSSGSTYWGALVEGNLDESTFIGNIENKIGLELPKSNYQNYTLYILSDPRKQGETLGIAFLADGQMVIGTTLAVKDVIDVTVGLQEPISGIVCNLYSQLGDALIKLASSVPEPLLEQIPAEIPIGPFTLSLLCFRDIEYATLALTKNEAIINAEARLVFANEDSAKDSGRLLWIGSKVGRYVAPDPNVKELLSKMHTSRAGSSVYLTLPLTISEIEQLILAMSQEAE
jgi:hypothetical protein